MDHFSVKKRVLHTSPQYSLMNSFFSAPSLMKIPQPATSDGASRRCFRYSLWIATFLQLQTTDLSSMPSPGRVTGGGNIIGRRREKEEAEIRKRGREGGKEEGEREERGGEGRKGERDKEEVLYIERRDRTKARGAVVIRRG